jgi:hypothetical protein
VTFDHGSAGGRRGRLFIACGSGFDDDTIRALEPAAATAGGGAAARALATVAGQAGRAGSEDGRCAESCFDSPQGLAVDPDRPGVLWVADYCNHAVRKVSMMMVVVVVVVTTTTTMGK